MGFNKAILMGRLVKDVDLKYASNEKGTVVARYTLAIDSGYGEYKRTDFINCVAFGKAGEFASQYFSKGKRVLVEGSIKIGEYEDKDKIKRKTFDIIIEKQEFADSSNGTKKEDKAESSVEDGFMEIEGSTDEDIPF